MLKKITLVALLAGLAATPLFAQNTAKDPLWIGYMNEPNPNYYKVKKAFDDYWKDSIPKKGWGYKVFKRWEYRVVNRLDSLGNVQWPQEQLTDLLNMPTTQLGGPSSGSTYTGLSNGNNTTPASPCPANGRWTPVGPINHPWNQTSQPTGIGRVAGIAFDPKDSNVIFLCAPQGGVWKSSNNGATWRQIFGTGPLSSTIGTTSMVVSYNGSDTMYVGTGDKDASDAPGYGVIASFDGGNTWVARNSGISGLYVGRMAMDPKNSKIILISTNNGIYRTTDGGVTWSQRLSGNAWDVVFHPFNRNIVYASISGYFYKSTDNGINFTQTTSGLPSSSYRGMIAVTANDRGYVYFLTTASATFQGLYRSTDSGSTFSTMSTTPNILGYSETGADANGQGWYDLDVTADPKSKNTVYVHGVNIWKSTNGGTNWSINGHWVGSGGADDIHADQHCAEWNITNNKLYAGNDGGIYYTANGGSRWNNISSGIQNSQIYRLAQAKTDAFVNAQGYQDNGSAQTSQDQFYTYYGGDGMDCQVDPTDASYVYGAYVYGSIYRAKDKTSITTLGAQNVNGITEGGPWLTPFVLQEGTPSRMFAGYYNIWRCDNTKTTGTPSWTKISNLLGGTNSYQMRFLESSPAQPKMLYALRSDNTLFRTSDASVASPSWTNLSTFLPGSARWLEAHPKDSNILYLCAGTGIYKSRNRGSSWINITNNLSGVGQIQCLILDTSGKKDAMYIGTEKGVYYSDTTMSSWINFSTGFPIWADVTDLDIYYSPKGSGYSKLVASTYGRGVWRTNLYEDGSATPVANFYTFDSVFVVGGKMRLYEQIKNSATSITWKITPYLYSYADGTDSTSANPVIQFNGSGLFTVKLTATNCQGNNVYTKSNWVKVFPKPVAANCYNTSTFQTTNYGIGILRFAMADNSSETGGYFDDGQNLDLSAGKIFRIKPSTSVSATSKTGLYNNEYFRIFIDYNNNGKFENYLGEAVASASTSLGSRTVTFSTPSNLKLNTGMRMRILSDFNSLDTNACRNLGYGQGEDYTVVYEKTIPYFKANKTAACLFENLTFTDTSVGLVGQWEWDFGAGAIPSTAAGIGPHSVYYTTTGNKTVRLRINGLDSVRKTNYLTISNGPIPQVVVKSGAISACEGKSITLAARATNGVSFTVQWQKNGANLSGKTDTLLTLTNMTLSDTGTYKAVLTNGACVATSTGVKITVFPKPVVSFTDNGTPQCFRLNKFIYTNTTTIANGSISSWLWRHGDGSTATTQNSSRTYASVNNYTVKLIATSNNGCMDSTSKSVTINYSATPKFTVNDTDQCLSGNSFVFTNKSTIPSGSLTYTWQFGDATSSTSTSPTKSYSASAFYTARLITTSNLGCKDTVTKPIRVYSQPSISYSVNNTAQCFRYNNFTFTNSTTTSDGTLSYLWRYGNGATSTATSPSYKYPAYGNYTAKLIATTSFGCKDSQGTSINVYPQTTLKFAANDSDQCLSGNSFVFTNSSSIPTGSTSYNWNFGDATSSTSVSPTKSYSARGTYMVQLISTSDKGCKDSLNKSVRVYSQPAVSFTKSANAQCLKINNFTFTNTTTNVDGIVAYTWHFGDGTTSPALNATKKYTTDGTYNVKLITQTSYGCKDSNTQTVTVHPQGQLKISVNDSDQCLAGNSFVFGNASSIKSGSLNYIWYFGDNSNSSLNTPSHTYFFYGNYTVLLTSASNNLCRDTVSKKIRVYGQPNPDFSINKSPQCLKGNNFTATNLSTNADGTYSVKYAFGNGNTSTQLNPTWSYNSAGNYTVIQVVTTQYGCRDSLTQPVVVHPKALVKFSVNDSDQCFSGHQFVFTNNSSVSTGSLNAFKWQFGDASQASTTSANHNYAVYGTYSVLLIATSNTICTDSISKSVRVYAQPVANFNISPINTQCLKYNQFNETSTATSVDGNLSNYWDNGDGTKSNSAANSHSYTQHGNYNIKLIVTSIYGCKDSISKGVTIYPMPKPDFNIDKNIHCENETVNFTNTSTIANGSNTYKWDLAGSNSTTVNASSSYAKYGNYTILLIATSDKNCTDSISKSTTIASNPVQKIISNPLRGCANQTLFSYTDSSINPDGSALKHYWNYGDGKLDSGFKVSHMYTLPGNFPITLVSKSPYCQSSTGYTQKVDPSVHAYFVMDTVNYETRRFKAIDTIIKGYQYKWFFEDKTNAIGNPVTHKFPDNSSYGVSLKVSSSIGCTDSAGTIVKINSPNYKDQDNALNFYVYPNPTTGFFTYKFEIKEKRSLQVKLYDVKGQLALWEKDWTDLEPGTYYEQVNMKTLDVSPGTYPFVIVSGNDKVTIKIIYTGK